MKAIILIGIISVIAIITFSITVVAKTEIQKYKTLFRERNFEIRYYPEATLATVNLSGNYDDMRNSGFRVLASYIFGGNTENMQIAMTAPVRVSQNGETSSMSFVMPAKYKIEDLPVPQTSKVKLHQSNPNYVASIKFGGFVTNKVIKQKEKELKEKLSRLGLHHNNNFEYLGYNPPYQIINRRNEVVVELVDFNPEMWTSNK